ncbi:hypothetical protein MA16_Dca008607 [Dendrobium catenatum]|uniref:Uncharacterized protein n=1 Tax=Dendrobium catenatum TaxID=906689 RepID=A0A2I0WA63_9ASPA|nr:hypothetical protein MA16_Dca008607 [Dendrobium catenatum]
MTFESKLFYPIQRLVNLKRRKEYAGNGSFVGQSTAFCSSNPAKSVVKQFYSDLSTDELHILNEFNLSLRSPIRKNSACRARINSEM